MVHSTVEKAATSIDAQPFVTPATARWADRLLRQLARREALLRRALGRLAVTFVDRSCHHALGFVRVGDYTRERLGLSASQFYEMARVSRALDRLPALAHAFEHGELGWAKVREVTGAALAETDAEWLRIARELTADGLRMVAKHVSQDALERRESRRAVGSVDGGVEAADAGPFDSEACDGRRASGDADDNDGQCLGRREGDDPGTAESSGALARAALRRAVAAVTSESGPSGGDAMVEVTDDEIDGEPAAMFSLRCPPHVARMWSRARNLARKTDGGELWGWQVAELVAAEGFSAVGWSRWGEQTPAAQARRRAPVPLRIFDDTHVGGDTDVAWIAELERAVESVDPSLWERREALNAHELDTRLRRLLALMQQGDADLGRALRLFFALGLHRDLGYSSHESYVRYRLNLCGRKLRGLLALERAATRSSAALTEAYRSGAISWCRALMLLPVLTAENAAAWVRRAQEVTARRLADEIEWALDVSANAPSRTSIFPPSESSANDTEPFATCRSHAIPIVNDEPAAVVAPPQSVHSGAGPSERQFGGDAASECLFEDADSAVARRTCVVRFWGPVSVVSMTYAAIDAFRRRRHIDEPAWCGLERLLNHVITNWEDVPKHRDAVFERDDWRCRVPVCTSRRHLHDHHLIYRSQGGGDQLDNRITVCAWHHLRGIHAGKVRVERDDDGTLVWDIGIAGSGTPLVRLRGEAYRDTAGASFEASAGPAEPPVHAAARA